MTIKLLSIIILPAQNHPNEIISVNYLSPGKNDSQNMRYLIKTQKPENALFTGFFSGAEDEGLEPSSPKGGGFKDLQIQCGSYLKLKANYPLL